MGNQDMLMRLEDVERLRREAAKGQANSKWSGDGLGVALDKNSRPPRLFGMTELPLDSVSDVRALYAALATRNTAGTLMNDSSSRSHCFAFLTLRAYDAKDDTIRTSRFQFVDLAGSERLRDAHGNDAKWSEVGEAMKGLVTNYSLMQARAPQAAHTPSFLPSGSPIARSGERASHTCMSDPSLRRARGSSRRARGGSSRSRGRTAARTSRSRPSSSTSCRCCRSR